MLDACARSGAVLTAGALEVLKGASGSASHYALAHPWAIGATLAGAGLILAPGAVAVPVMNAAGLTLNGVAAGSTAATFQSGIGNVAAGSFALLQSAAAGGPGAATVTNVIQSAGGLVLSMSGVAAIRSKL